jgi:hypothetical protein
VASAVAMRAIFMEFLLAGCVDLDGNPSTERRARA